MKILTAYCTDVGIVKEVNQDALLIKTAKYKNMDIALMCICDGMGGLAMGEFASSKMTVRFSEWFNYRLASILEQENRKAEILKQWVDLLEKTNNELIEYGKSQGIMLGTTCTVMLIVDEDYYIIHIGDTRIYEVRDSIKQMTPDHTLVAREIAMGRLTPDEAEKDLRRNVLLQCIGVSEEITPHFFAGKVPPNVSYILCSDGFRHVITSQELLLAFSGSNICDEDSMENQCRRLVELNKARHESDNISVIVAHVEE